MQLSLIFLLKVCAGLLNNDSKDKDNSKYQEKKWQVPIPLISLTIIKIFYH